MRNKLHLYWLENNWQKRGYSMNYNLVVDLEEKRFLPIRTRSTATNARKILK